MKTQKEFNWTLEDSEVKIENLEIYVAEDKTHFTINNGMEIDPHCFDYYRNIYFERLGDCFNDLRIEGGYLLTVGRNYFSDCETICANGFSRLNDIGDLSGWSKERIDEFAKKNNVTFVRDDTLMNNLDYLNQNRLCPPIEYPFYVGNYTVNDDAQTLLFEVPKQGGTI